MTDLLITPCGRDESLSYKPFTEETLAQHIRDCHTCNPPVMRANSFQYKRITGKSIPDGAYFALRNEGAPEGWE